MVTGVGHVSHVPVQAAEPPPEQPWRLVGEETPEEESESEPSRPTRVHMFLHTAG